MTERSAVRSAKSFHEHSNFEYDTLEFKYYKTVK